MVLAILDQLAGGDIRIGEGAGLDESHDALSAKGSEATIPILFCGEAKTRANFNEVDIETLVSPTKPAQALALEILKIDPPTPLLR